MNMVDSECRKGLKFYLILHHDFLKMCFVCNSWSGSTNVRTTTSAMTLECGTVRVCAMS